MTEALICKNPTLKAITVQQVSDCMGALVSGLGISPKQARFMMSKKPAMLLTTPVPQLQQQLRLLARLNNITARLTLKWATLTPSVLSRDAALLTQRISRLGLVLAAPPRVIVRMMIACPHYLTDRYALLSRRLDLLARLLQRNRHAACRVAQRCPTILFLSPRIVNNKIAALMSVLDRRRRFVLTLIVKCPKLLRSSTDSVRATYDQLRPLMGVTQDFVFAMACHGPGVLRLSLVPLRQRLQRLRHSVNAVSEWAAQWRRMKPPQRQELLDVRLSTLSRLDYLVASRQTADTSLLEILLWKRRDFVARYPSMEKWEIQMGFKPAPVFLPAAPLATQTQPTSPLSPHSATHASPLTPSDRQPAVAPQQAPQPSSPTSRAGGRRGSSLLGLGLHTQPASLQSNPSRPHPSDSTPSETRMPSSSSIRMGAPVRASREQHSSQQHEQRSTSYHQHSQQQQQQQQQQQAPTQQQQQQPRFSSDTFSQAERHEYDSPGLFDHQQRQQQYSHQAPHMQHDAHSSRYQPCDSHSHQHHQQQHPVHRQQVPTLKLQLRREAMLLQAQLAIWQQGSQGRKEKPSKTVSAPTSVTQPATDGHLLDRHLPSRPPQPFRTLPGHLQTQPSPVQRLGSVHGVGEAVADSGSSSDDTHGISPAAHRSPEATPPNFALAQPTRSKPSLTLKPRAVPARLDECTSSGNSQSSSNGGGNGGGSNGSRPVDGIMFNDGVFSSNSSDGISNGDSPATVGNSSQQQQPDAHTHSVFPQRVNSLGSTVHPQPSSGHPDAGVSSGAHSSPGTSSGSSTGGSRAGSCSGGTQHAAAATTPAALAPPSVASGSSRGDRGRTNRERRSRKPGLVPGTGEEIRMATVGAGDVHLNGGPQPCALNQSPEPVGGGSPSPEMERSAGRFDSQTDSQAGHPPIQSRHSQEGAHCSSSSDSSSNSSSTPHHDVQAPAGCGPLISPVSTSTPMSAAGAAQGGVAWDQGVGSERSGAGPKGQNSAQDVSVSHKWPREGVAPVRKGLRNRSASSQRASVERLQAVFDDALEGPDQGQQQAGEDADAPTHAMV
ncbi:MAG: hypothetical protein WDW38_003269 [Sanguina aurantia]